MATVTIGNFFTTSDGRNVLGGVGGSGLNTEELLNSLMEIRRLPIIQAEDKIEINNEQLTALSTFHSLLTIFQSAADALRNPPGVGNAGDNVFQYTTTTVTASDGSTASNYLTVTSTPGAAKQAYTVGHITSIATAATQVAGSFTIADADSIIVSASPIGGTANQFNVGTITFNGEDITFEEGDTLNEVAAKFNAVSDETGVAATIIQVADGEFQLFFSATETGTDANFDLTTATDPSGVLTGASVDAAVAGTNAVFQLNGLTITRQSNTVDDVIDGLTFNLLQPFDTGMTAASLTVNVVADTTTVQNSIVTFVQAYNALKTFEAEQTELNADGTNAATALLINNQAFLNIMADIKLRVTSAVEGIASGPTSLSDVGITFTTQPSDGELPAVENILTINDAELTAALAGDFEGVNALFGFTLDSDNPNITVFSSTNALGVSEFTLDLDTTPGSELFEATYDLGAGPVTVELEFTSLGSAGYSLSGPAGSALEGLVLIYGSTTSATGVSVTATNGLAAMSYNTVDTALELNTGTLSIEMEAFEDENTRLEEEIVRLEEQVAMYQEQLLIRFAALEATISSVNTLLASLEAQQNAAIAAAG